MTDFDNLIKEKAERICQLVLLCGKIWQTLLLF